MSRDSNIRRDARANALAYCQSDHDILNPYDTRTHEYDVWRKAYLDECDSLTEDAQQPSRVDLAMAHLDEDFTEEQQISLRAAFEALIDD